MGVEPSTYPDSNVFINKLGIRDPRKLDKAESDYSAVRTEEYRTTPYPGQFDLKHLKAIHRLLFGDIYEWAGEERGYDIRKGICEFTPHQEIKQHANKLFAELNNENFLKGLIVERFVERIAHYYDLINRIHPFPEGNGRTQRLFIEHLAANAGYEVDWSIVRSWQINEVAVKSFEGNKDPTIFLFEDITMLFSIQQ